MALWKRVSLIAAAFAVGAVAGDFAVRGSKSPAPPEAGSKSAQVIQKRKVRTVHVRPRATPAGGSAAMTPAVAQPAAGPSPTPVSSRTSPGANGGAGDEEAGEGIERDD